MRHIAIALLLRAHAACWFPPRTASDRLRHPARQHHLRHAPALTMPRRRRQRIVILDIDEKSLNAEWPLALEPQQAGRDDRRALRALRRRARRLRRGVRRAGHELGPGGARRAGKGELKDNAEFQARPRRSCARSSTTTRSFAAAEGPAGGARLLLQRRGARSRGELPCRRRCCRQGTSADRRRRVHTPGAGYSGNLPILQSRRRRRPLQSAGSTSTACSRRVPLLMEYEGDYYEALSLAMVRTLPRASAGDADVRPSRGFRQDRPRHLEWLTARQPARSRSTTASRRWCRIAAPAGSFRYVSAADVIRGDASPAERAEGQDRAGRHHRRRACWTCARRRSRGLSPASRSTRT